MGHRILVVDDEPHIRTLLRAYLEAEGHLVTEAASGADALHRALATDGSAPDLVLLDVGLPDLDGLVGLSAGADDYVTKPFSPREVVARVRTVLRRAGRATQAADAQDQVLRFHGLTLDEQRRELTVDGAPVVLSSLEFDLLRALASSPGRVFSRTQLLEEAWGYDFYGDPRVVDVHIRSIRNALGDDASAPRIIGTVRGVGYKFLPTPAEVGS